MIALFAAAATLLFFVWVIYPLTVLVVSRFYPRLVPPDLGTTTVSVVIATREEARQITDRVSTLLSGDSPLGGLEVIVALDRNGGRARPDELHGLDPRVIVVMGDAPGGKAATLNAGVRVARGQVLVFADSHQVFGDGTLLKMAAMATDTRFGAASGRLVLVPPEDGLSVMHWYLGYEVAIRSAEARVHSSVGVVGAGYAMRRELWRPLPVGLILDDVYTPMRLILEGHRIAFLPDAALFDPRPPEPSSEYHRKVRTLTGNLQLVALMPAVLNPRRNPVWTQYVSHKLLRLLTPFAVIIAALSGLIIAVETWPRGMTQAVAGTAIVALIASAFRPTREALGDGLEWFWGLQAAAVMACVNAVRRQWNVWT
jgi:cellulose synthase/poly-beta-1,6-N-acetylglucosamine synthase-like glycosyltransferase